MIGSYPIRALRGIPADLLQAVYPALSGFQLRWGNRQSMPSSSIANWGSVPVEGEMTP